MRISAPNGLGSSDGPLFDASGNVLAVAEGRLDAVGLPQTIGDLRANVSLAITSNMLQGFLDAHGVEFETAALGVGSSAALVGAKAKDVVALVECWQ